MKSTLTFPRVSPGIIAAFVAAVVILTGAAVLIAHADTAPTMTNAIQDGSNTTIVSAAIGTPVHDTVTVASTTASTTPTGTVNFNLFSNTSCTGTPVTQSGVALVNGSAQSSTTTVPAGGLSYLVNYGGDASTTAANSSCQALTASSSAVTLSTALSTSSVLVGSSVNDSATLGNETANATGTVAYNVYTDNLCTLGAQSAGVMTVTNDVVPNSSALPFNTAGTFFWQAVYSGDQNNNSATSACQSEILTVSTTTPVVTPPATTTPGVISGTVYKDANRNDVMDSGDTGLAGFTVWLHMGTKNDGYNNPIIMTATTDANGHYAFGNLAFGSYFVEEQEQKQNGLDQTSSDTKVVLSSTNPGATVDFANVMKNQNNNGNGHQGDGNNATSTNNGKHDGDNDGDDNGTSTNNNNGGGNGNGFGHFFQGVINAIPVFNHSNDNSNNSNNSGQGKNGGNNSGGNGNNGNGNSGNHGKGK